MDPGKHEVAHNDLAWLLLTSLRYSLGRRSYAPGLTSEIILRHRSALNEHELRNMVGDIREHLRINTDEAADLRETWIKLADELEKA